MTDCLNFLVSLRIQINKQFLLLEEKGVVAWLGILDPAATQDLATSPSLITNMGLHFLPSCAWRSAGGYFGS